MKVLYYVCDVCGKKCEPRLLSGKVEGDVCSLVCLAKLEKR